MSIKFGEISATQILDNEFRIRILEKLFEHLANSGVALPAPDMKEIQRQVVAELQKKYPNLAARFSSRRPTRPRSSARCASTAKAATNTRMCAWG